MKNVWIVAAIAALALSVAPSAHASRFHVRRHVRNGAHYVRVKMHHGHMHMHNMLYHGHM